MVTDEELSRTKKARKELILNKAYDMCIERGVEKTSMNDIADECNITRRTIYNYFETKKDLLLFLMDQKMESVLEKHKYKKNFNVNGYEDLESLLQHIFEICYETREEIAFIIQVKIILSHDTKDYKTRSFLEEIFLNYFRYYDDILERGLADGSMSQESFNGYTIREKTELIFYCAYGYLSFIILDQNFSKEQYDQSVNKLKTDILRMVRVK